MQISRRRYDDPDVATLVARLQAEYALIYGGPDDSPTSAGQFPFAGLGQALAEAGHLVTIAAHGGFENPIRDAGLSVVELPLNPRSRRSSDGR